MKGRKMVYTEPEGSTDHNITLPSGNPFPMRGVAVVDTQLTAGLYRPVRGRLIQESKSWIVVLNEHPKITIVWCFATLSEAKCRLAAGEAYQREVLEAINKEVPHGMDSVQSSDDA